MSLTNPNKPITKGDLKQFYDTIRPYMGGLVSSKAGFTPVGTIISVMGTTAPANYLACNGQIVNVADYQELADYFENQFGTKYKFGGSGTTFGIPDLRGEFLRGTGTNSHTDQGNGGDVGAHQDATAVPNLVITGNDNANMLQVYWSSGYQYPLNADGTKFKNQTQWNNYNRSNAGSGKSDGLVNVRPTNTSVLYCIATKNFYIDPSHDYSTSEKVIGTWIDGKPLYQKTWIGTITSGSGANQRYMVEENVVSKYNIDEVVSLTGMTKDNQISYGSTYTNTAEDQFRPLLYNVAGGTNGLTFYYGTFPAKPFKFIITMQYTKTTD